MKLVRIPSSRSAGMTLIEVLAVVALASLAVGIAGFRGGIRSPASKLDRCESVLQDMDVRSRMIALRSGGCTLAISETRLRTFDSKGLEDASRELPKGARLGLPEGPESIVFDALGRTDDYSIRLESSGSIRQVARSGSTGWAEVIEP